MKAKSELIQITLSFAKEEASEPMALCLFGISTTIILMDFELLFLQTRKGTLLAIRTAGFCRAASDAGALYLVESPAERDGHPSIFRIEELEKALQTDGFCRTRLRQCRYGADAAKRTDFVDNFEFAALDQCDHPRVWWRSPPSRKWPDGKRFQAPHAPLLGKRRAILDSQ